MANSFQKTGFAKWFILTKRRSCRFKISQPSTLKRRFSLQSDSSQTSWGWCVSVGPDAGWGHSGHRALLGWGRPPAKGKRHAGAVGERAPTNTDVPLASAGLLSRERAGTTWDRACSLACAFVLVLEKGLKVRLYLPLKPGRFVRFAVLEMDPTAGRLERVSGRTQWASCEDNTVNSGSCDGIKLLRSVALAPVASRR